MVNIIKDGNRSIIASYEFDKINGYLEIIGNEVIDYLATEKSVIGGLLTYGLEELGSIKFEGELYNGLEDLDFEKISIKLNPMKIRLINPTDQVVAALGEVTSPMIVDNNTKKLHSEGLYSQEIFGSVGSPVRLTKFGYIKLNTKIIHPHVYGIIIKLSKLYEDIINGKKYAIFNKKEKDFEVSNMDDGDTGYDFFFKHINELQPKRNDSDIRNIMIDVFEKYRKANTIIINNMLVIPAGLRDLQERDGRFVEEEINDKYRALLGTANLFKNNVLDDEELYLMDTSRLKLQNIVKDIYDYFININDGKKKYLRGKWLNRSIEYGTANVLTSIPIKIPNADSKNAPDLNTSYVGIFQYVKAILPIAYHLVKSKFLKNVINEIGGSRLVDPKTMQHVPVQLRPKTLDRWSSSNGFNVIINRMLSDDVKNEPVILDDYYLGLLYKDGNKVQYIYDTTTHLTDEMLEKKYNIKPITYGELLYLSIYETIKKYPGFVTRYPVTGQGSIYPTLPIVLTTVKSDTVTYIDDNNIAYKIDNYPRIGLKWINSFSVHYSKLKGLGGDYDGDKVNFTVVWSDEAIEEIHDLMNDPSFYISPEGNIVGSLNDDIVNNVISELTKH